MRTLLLVGVIGLVGCSTFDGEPNSVDSQLVAVRVDPDLNSSVIDVDGVAVSGAAYREVVEVNGEFKKNLATGVTSFEFKPGFLKPQLVKFLANHPRIGSESNVVWRASDNYQWPSEFVVEGDTFEHAISKVLKPYKLEALFRPNNIVVIQPKQ